jgi:hypothetical protein
MICSHCSKEFPDPIWPQTRAKYCSILCNKRAYAARNRNRLRTQWKLWQQSHRSNRLHAQRKYNKSANGIACKLRYSEAHREELSRNYLQAYKTNPHVRALHISRATARKLMKRSEVPAVCTDCGSTKKVECHHRNFDSLDNTLANLVLLCKRCHALKHSDPEGF